MNATDIRHRFIERRAQGWSLARIAAELHVSKTTLVEWNRAAQREIRELKEVELEALQERLLASHEVELQRLTAQLERIESVLGQRQLDCLSTESLFVLAATVRAQLRRLTAAPVGGALGAPLTAPEPAPVEVQP